MSLVIVGSVALDDVATQVEARTGLLGGAASYACVAASLFFKPVRMVGIVGDDFPQAHTELYTSHGIDLTGLERVPGKTFRWGGVYEQNMNVRRTTFTELNVFETFSPKLPPVHQDSQIALLANIHPDLQHCVLDQLKSPRFVMADTMNLWIEIARRELMELLKRIDMLILNDSEALMLSGEPNVIKAAKWITQQGPRYALVKKGEHGCFLYGDGQFFALPALPLEQVVDPTGAGDAFAGGFAGYLAQSENVDWKQLKHALIEGTLAASFTVEDFSLNRLHAVTPEEIASRRAQLLSMMTL